MVKNHELGIAEDQSSKENFVLAAFPYVLRTDRKDYHVEYDVFDFKRYKQRCQDHAKRHEAGSALGFSSPSL